jgi:hypothetical protein
VRTNPSPISFTALSLSFLVLPCLTSVNHLSFFWHPSSDPLHTKTDAELLAVLQRAWLLPPDVGTGVKDAAAEAKFSLDASVGDEGSNYSAGEKQLLALCRALVRGSSVIVLVCNTSLSLPLCFRVGVCWFTEKLLTLPQDEATSNVDVETDAKVQRTIQTEFKNATLLCIAHRLNTIGKGDLCSWKLFCHHLIYFLVCSRSLLRSNPRHGCRQSRRV